MKSKHIFALVGCLIGCMLILFVLYSFSPLSNKTIYRSNFERAFAQEGIVTQKGIIDVEYNSFYIAGTSSDQVYLGNYSAPAHLLIVNSNSLDTLHVRLKISAQKVENAGIFQLKVDSPYFYLTHGTIPAVFRGKVGQWEANQFMPDGPYFVDAVPGDSAYSDHFISFQSDHLISGQTDHRFSHQSDHLI